MTVVAQPPASGRTPLKKAPPSLFAMLFGILTVVVYVGALIVSFATASSEVWGALLLVPVLIAVTAPLCTAAARAENDARVARLLMIALVLKFVGALVRYAVAFQTYGGEADSKAYDKAGRILAAGFRAGQFTNTGQGRISDTHFIEVLTGWVYAIFGSSLLGGYFVFSWLGFLGLYMFYRAFVIAVPHGDRRRYARLLFFMPSLLFWSSSIGKEAWMTFTIGAVAYGAARAFTKKPFAFPILALGIWGTEVCRPHMALLLLGGLLPAYLLRRAPKVGEKKQSLKILGIAVLVGAVVFTLGGVEQRFKITTVNSSTTTGVLDFTQGQTTTGGSNFSPIRVHSPVQFPGAFMTVLFRPFPNEASTAQGIVSSLEGMFLIFMLLTSFDRLRGLPRELANTPYVLFCLIYTFAFVWAFSTIANFGILVRQRVQVYPLFFVLLALPKVSAAAKKKKRGRSRKTTYTPRAAIESA